jgi:hypothetical protein
MCTEFYSLLYHGATHAHHMAVCLLQLLHSYNSQDIRIVFKYISFRVSEWEETSILFYWIPEFRGFIYAYDIESTCYGSLTSERRYVGRLASKLFGFSLDRDATFQTEICHHFSPSLYTSSGVNAAVDSFHILSSSLFSVSQLFYSA